MALINSSIRLKLFLLVAVIILPVNSIFPQSAYIDSLRHVISNQPDNLTKTENLISIAKEFTKINFDSVALYTNKAEPLVKKFNYPAGRAETHYTG